MKVITNNGNETVISRLSVEQYNDDRIVRGDTLVIVQVKLVFD